MITIIDYGAGNTGSVINAIESLGFKPILTSNVIQILDADAVILPGVGAAGDTVEKLTELGMHNVIRSLIVNKRPLLAICIGLQVLFSHTEEGGGRKCLDIIPGKVKKLSPGLKIPHMGWNQVEQKMSNRIFEGIPNKANFYFVHSYFADPIDKSIIAGTTEYGLEFCSIIIKDNLIATQFHPEKSGEIGLRLYANFIDSALDKGKL